ncbi:MAG: hypothetical protein ACRC76_13695 [Proteocatella sp.]
MKNKRQLFYRIGIILGTLLAFINMLFNSANDNVLLAMSAPVIIYISLFGIRVIRIPQIVFEFLLFLLMFLSIDYLSKYFLIIVLISVLYLFIVLALHFFRIWSFVEE